MSTKGHEWFRAQVRAKTREDGIFNSQYWFGWIDGYCENETERKALRHIITYWSN